MPPAAGASADAVTGLTAPRTVIAAPLYNHADYLEPALDSLLGQTHRDFALVLVDDLSDDDTPLIARRYAQRDPRVTYERNEVRLGLVGNWRRCFEVARERYPQAEYFAWASDHDLWDRRWLEALMRALDERPEVVLAYPTSERITAEGEVSHRRGGFETVDVDSAATRLRLGCRSKKGGERGGHHAGDMVYGLMRTRCLEVAGVFRPVLEPDRLLLAELSVQGQFRHVPEVLWNRRFVGTAVRARQRRAIFPHRRPLYSWLAPWIVRPAVFFWVYGAQRAQVRPEVDRQQGAALAGLYAVASVQQVIERRWMLARKRLRRARRRLQRARKRVVRPFRRSLGLALRRARRTWRPMRRFARRTWCTGARRREIAARLFGASRERPQPPSEPAEYVATMGKRNDVDRDAEVSRREAAASRSAS